jgi:hypothetical protein
MGQHRRAIFTKSQPPEKKTQSPFCQNLFKTLKIQGSRSTVPGLRDGSGFVSFRTLNEAVERRQGEPSAGWSESQMRSQRPMKLGQCFLPLHRLGAGFAKEIATNTCTAGVSSCIIGGFVSAICRRLRPRVLQTNRFPGWEWNSIFKYQI